MSLHYNIKKVGNSWLFFRLRRMLMFSQTDNADSFITTVQIEKKWGEMYNWKNLYKLNLDILWNKNLVKPSGS